MFKTGGEKLKELREFLGLTQEEMAKQLGVTRSTISHYEIGKREPDSEYFLELQNHYGVSDKWIGEVVIEIAKYKKYACSNNESRN